MEFPNLPYIDNKGYKVSESYAIPRYIARTFNKELLGKDDN